MAEATIPALEMQINLCTVTKSTLLQIHQNQLENNTSNDHNTSKLIEALGGMDRILTDYLTSTNEMILNETQLQDIKEIITSSDDRTATNVFSFESLPSGSPTIMTSISSVSTMGPKESRKQLSYTFSKSNTYYNSIFNDETSSKIIYYLYNKWIVVILVILGFVWVIWANLEHGEWSRSYEIFKMIYLLILMIYCCLYMLSMNRKVMQKSTKHFVFWFKILVAIEIATAHFLSRYILLKDRNIGGVEISGDIFGRISSILIITVCSGVDGFQMSRKIKIWIGVGVSLIFSVDAMYQTFLVDQTKHEQATIYITDLVGISALSVQASAARVLSIFLWKQTVLLIIKKNECVNIRTSPYIIWLD